MIIFLHGDDTYRSREKFRELRQKFLREVDPSGMNLVTVDGTSATTDEIWAAVAAQSFLVRKRMVVIEDLGAQKSSAVRDGVAALLEKIPEDVIAVFWEGCSHSPASSRLSTPSTRAKRRISPKREKETATKRAPQKNDVLFPSLLTHATHTQEFTQLQGRELELWVRAYTKTLNATIDATATRELMTIIGSDLWRMHNELEKLTAAAKSFSPSHGEGEREGEGTITSALVHEFVEAAPSDTPFAFLDAVGCGDRAGAIRCLRELEAARVDPHHLLSMLHRQLRLLVMASDCLERGIAPSRLAVELGVHPYVAQKLGQQTSATSLPKLRALYPRLLDLDRKLKYSRTPWQALMDLFVLDATLG